MKKYLLLLTTVIAIVAGTPFATGMMAEKQYHSMIQANMLKPTFNLETRHFRRGFFSSQATTFIEIIDPALRNSLSNRIAKDESGKVGVLVHHHLNHGPITFTAEKNIDFEVAHITHQIEYQHFGKNSTDEKPADTNLFQLDSKLHFDGSQTINIESQEILTTADNATTTLMPLSMTFVTDRNFQTIKAEGNWKGVISEGLQGEKLNASDSEFGLDLKKNGELWLGSMNIAQNSIVLNSSRVSFQMRDLKIKSNSFENGVDRLIDSSAQLSLQNVKTADKIFGPAQVSLAINNIPATALERLNAIQQKAINSPSASSDFALQGAAVEALTLLPQLISHGIVIDVDKLYLNTPDGEIIGHFNLTLSKSNALSLMNIPHLKSIITLDAALSLPVAIIPKATMHGKIQPLLDRGYLRMDGEYLKSVVKMRNSLLTMNDKIVPLPY